LYTEILYNKNYECVIIQVTNGALISAWKCKAGLRPDPLEELTAPSQIA